MSFYKTTQAMHSVTGMPEDDVITTYHWRTDEAGHSVVTAAALNGHVAAAWNTITAPGTSLPCDWISPEISRTILPTCKTYDEAGGSPLAVNNWLAFSGTPSAKAFPAEVAVCLSFNGDLTDIPEELPDDADPDARPERPASRRRGRIFVGPLTDQAGGSTEPVRPVAFMKNDLLGLGVFLANPTNATLTSIGTTWGVWSKEQENAPFTPIVQVSVDDAFDTQRRRGVAKTSRVIQAV